MAIRAKNRNIFSSILSHLTTGPNQNYYTEIFLIMSATKIAQMVIRAKNRNTFRSILNHQTTGPNQNYFTEMFLIMPPTKIAKGSQGLLWVRICCANTLAKS